MGVAIMGRGLRPRLLPRTQSGQRPRRRGQSAGGGFQRSSLVPAVKQRPRGAEQVWMSARGVLDWTRLGGQRPVDDHRELWGDLASTASSRGLRPLPPPFCGEAGRGLIGACAASFGRDLAKRTARAGGLAGN